MNLTRRNLLLATGSLPFARLALADTPTPGTTPVISQTLPFKQGFHSHNLTYLDSGSQHPLSLAAQAAAQSYLAQRALDPAAADFDRNEQGVLSKYAQLVNADVDEV